MLDHDEARQRSPAPSLEVRRQHVIFVAFDIDLENVDMINAGLIDNGRQGTRWHCHARTASINGQRPPTLIATTKQHRLALIVTHCDIENSQFQRSINKAGPCLLYTSDAADE